MIREGMVAFATIPSPLIEDDMNERDVGLAIGMLEDSEEYIEDARRFAPIGNSVVGSLLSIMHDIPRQYSEAAVREAVRRLDAEGDE